MTRLIATLNAALCSSPKAMSAFFLCLITIPQAYAADAATSQYENVGQYSDSNAQIRLDTPSGYPVPRFVSLKATKTYCRTGPSFAHPVRITFMRKGLPVMVIAETKDHWRKIRDLEGDQCWTHKSKLSGIKTALVTQDGLELHAWPKNTAPMRALLGQGLITHIDDTRGKWVHISAEGVKGWTKQSGLWGLGNAAPHN